MHAYIYKSNSRKVQGIFIPNSRIVTWNPECLMRRVRRIRDHEYVNAQRLFVTILKSVSSQIFSSLQIQQSVLTIAEIYSFQLDAQRIWWIVDYRIFIHAYMGLRGQQTKGLLCYNLGGLNFLEICSEGTLIAFNTIPYVRKAWIFERNYYYHRN